MGTWMAYLVLWRLAWDAGQMAEAVASVRALLAPSQMGCPRPIEERLRAALAAWDAGQSDEAHQEMGHALRLAGEWEYR